MTEPTDAEIIAVMRDGYNCRYNDEQDHVDFARAVLAKWGTPQQEAQQPAPSVASLRVVFEQATRQALETLERASDAGYSVECDETITALREALEQVAPRKTEQWNPMNSSNAETALQMAAVIAHRDTEAAHQQAAPQADSQPAPLHEGEWINDAGRIKWLLWRVQDLEAQLAARPPAYSVQDLQPVHDAVTIDLLNERVAYLERKLKEADSVLEDAARWQTFIALPYATRAEWASNLSLAPVLTQWVDAARKQGANHD